MSGSSMINESISIHQHDKVETDPRQSKRAKVWRVPGHTVCATLYTLELDTGAAYPRSAPSLPPNALRFTTAGSQC